MGSEEETRDTLGHELRAIVAEIEACGFGCVAGPLEHHVAWLRLKKLIEEELDVYGLAAEP